MARRHRAQGPVHQATNRRNLPVDVPAPFRPRRERDRQLRRAPRSVGVGIPVTQHPVHSSVRAELPHTAPALGLDDQASRMRPVVSVCGQLWREPGSVSGARCRQTNFPCPAAFPPPPPLPGHFRPRFVRRLINNRYDGAVRLPSAMAHRRRPEGFPMRSALNSMLQKRPWDLPVPEQSASVHARGLGPPERVNGYAAGGGINLT